jgi:exodeoxyribonuclease V gamma subunit
VLHVHRAERADALIDALRELLATPPADPFAPEVVAVPTRGMERWLTQRMAARLGASAGRADGVCANVEFPPPRRLVGEAVAAASGIDPEADPWLPERMVWPLLEVVDGSLLEPWAQPLAAFLGGTEGDANRRARRFATVRHVAALFDRYALHRPDMLHAWAQGEDAPARWQAELWRRLNERIGVPGPAERLDAACAALRGDPGLVALPERLSLFGLTRLPAGRLRVLRALAAQRDVHLFLLHPSPALWDKVAAALDGPIARRADDVTARLPANRLLASWGQDSRELQVVLGEHVSHHHQVEIEGSSLLARLQRDVREDRAPEPLPLHPADRSVEVHACHGRARQVEVARDAILHLLAEDPTLEPRDVIVMCPDVETFAPLIQAAFGATEDDEAIPEDRRPPDLRVRLADRAIRQTNPLLGVAGRLLELASERLTASQVIDLADREPVRRRFRLDDEDLGRIEDWVQASGIRWGLDAEHRAPFKLAAVPAGTWRAGVDRVLLGVTMTEDEQRLFGGVLPLDDVESGAIELAGRLAELIARVQAALERLGAPQPIAEWAEALAGAADALTATAPRDAWQRWELRRLLDDVVAESAGASTRLALPEVRALLAERLQGRPTRANFRTGHLTICTLVPMRSVPHRAVCLLGLDDAVFPRKGPRDGDDLMLDDPHVGDRDARAEDRQLLLDALMAARDRLIVTYTGNDERTNIATPPAVPVGELLDMIDRTAGPEAREQVVTRHPLQPFDVRNFAAERPWSFDRTTLEGARALLSERRPPAPFLSGPLDARPEPVVELPDLVAFAERPVRAFLRRRLGILAADYTDEVEDALPVELDGLGVWGVGTRLLEARLAGAEPRGAILAEIARGTLPPGVLGKPVVDRVAPVVEDIVRHVEPGETGSVDVKVSLRDRALRGTVAGVCGDELRTVTYSRVNARHRLAAWVRLLALTASSDRPFSAVTIGKARAEAEGGRVTVARIPPVGVALAHRELAALLDVYDRGMREPLPLYCFTSAAFAQGGEAAARAAWASTWNQPKEDAEPEHQLVHGGVLAFDALLADPRFAELARVVWRGLLEHERVTDE